MSSRAAKYGPIGAVAGVIGYSCLPYLDDPAKQVASKAAKPAELTVAMLSPLAAPDLHRDMFEKPGGSADAKPEPEAEAPATPPPTEKTAAQEEQKRPETIPAPSSLVLSGTFVRGAHRVAVINGALYAVGDRIVNDLPEATDCHVALVDADHVVLKINGQRAVLGYPDLLAELTSKEDKTPAGPRAEHLKPPQVPVPQIPAPPAPPAPERKTKKQPSADPAPSQAPPQAPPQASPEPASPSAQQPADTPNPPTNPAPSKPQSK